MQLQFSVYLIGTSLEEALLAPLDAPAVLDQPVVLSILGRAQAHNHDSMVQRVAAAAGVPCNRKAATKRGEDKLPIILCK